MGAEKTYQELQYELKYNMNRNSGFEKKQKFALKTTTKTMESCTSS